MAMFTSPKRHIIGQYNMPCSPPFNDNMMYPWNWAFGAQQIALSPGSSCGSPTAVSPGSASDADSEVDRYSQLRRGRPRCDKISSLILEGAQTVSTIRCKICKRVFPREKSLQAHLRTHTGERPYACDYPGCKKAFCQSGQLRTHQRLHTGEKPFVCSDPDCSHRFTHANRHCTSHPLAALRRDQSVVTEMANRSETNPAVMQWLIRQQQQEDSTATPPPAAKKSITALKKTPKTKRSLQSDIENDARAAGISGMMETCRKDEDTVLRSHCTIWHGRNDHRDADKRREQRDTMLGALALIQLSQGH